MELQDLDTFRSVDELVAYRDRLSARAAELDKEANGLPLTDDARAEWDAIAGSTSANGVRIAGQLEEVNARIAELQARHQYLAELAGSGEVVGTDIRQAVRTAHGGRLPDNIYELTAYRQAARSEADYAALMTEGARKAIDGAFYAHPSADQDKVKADLVKLIAKVDDPEALARRILVTGSPAYGQAFGKALSAMGTGGLNQAELGALSLGTDSAGGFAVPFQLDPTLIATSDGAINPLRSISRVERITGKKWQGVTSTGVTVSRGAENSPATDGSPTLDQPELDAIRVTGFVPFSIELDLAWGALQSEVARLLQDAKDMEEADSFINGDGAGPTVPNGLVGTMAPSSFVYTGDSTFGPEDVYSTKQHVVPRFRGRGQFLAEGGIYDEVRQFDTQGGSNMWVQLQDATPPRLIGYRSSEMSTMDGVVTDGANILAFGDFNQFLIVDRIGMTVELIPHLFRQATAGAGVGLPTGQRGIYAIWMNNCKILVAKAFALLQVGIGS